MEKKLVGKSPAGKRPIAPIEGVSFTLLNPEGEEILRIGYKGKLTPYESKSA